uniref:Uncharacterized protein n=1 Tax=Branchiostoma floridae TaxID=7739 RepID=C3YYR3_BRAFL|eukprot:XP_002598409.1 hypothetical protein BRAFLDRAFT_83184 [Branchiostoma floridae]
MESSERGKSEQNPDSVLDISDDRRVWIVPENEFDPQFLDELPLVSFTEQSEWIVSPPHAGQDGLAFWIPVKSDSKNPSVPEASPRKTVKHKVKSSHSVIRPTVAPTRERSYLPKALAGVVDTLWVSRGCTGQSPPPALLSDTTRPFAPHSFERLIQLKDYQRVPATPRGDCSRAMSGDAETPMVNPSLSQAVADIETNTGASDMKRRPIEPVICTPS